MANVARPIGFLQQGNTEGASPTFGQRYALIASSNATAIYKGDPVKLLSTGYIAQWTAATAGSQLAGIFLGCQYNTASGLVRSSYWPGSGAIGDVTAIIAPCNLSTPGWFLVQAVGATGILFADIGQTVDYCSVARAAETLAASHIPLIETFAQKLAAECLALGNVVSARVTVDKPFAIVRGLDGVEVEMRRGDRAWENWRVDGRQQRQGAAGAEALGRVLESGRAVEN